MRLDKFFSELKFLSRKEVALRVRKGAITVNGAPALRADQKIDELHDTVALDGTVVPYRRFIYLVLNKPQGYVCSTDDPRDRTVIDLLPEQLQRLALFPCGRLDKDTVGLVILTNDGVAAHNALSPRHHVAKRYRFKTADAYTDEDIAAIEAGLELADGYVTKPCSIERTDGREGYITLTEGKYHEIKRLFGARGNRIVYLQRVAFAHLTLDGLKLGAWREMTEDEIALFTAKP